MVSFEVTRGSSSDQQDRDYRCVIVILRVGKFMTELWIGKRKA
jgi:hypothetical protein